MKINHTGEYATEAERDEVRMLAEHAAQTPVANLNQMFPYPATSAWERAERKCYEYAMAHGLSHGEYGMDLHGEFIELVKE